VVSLPPSAPATTSDVPQCEQKRAPAGFALPHPVQ
jgi:hypothetical protein